MTRRRLRSESVKRTLHGTREDTILAEQRDTQKLLDVGKQENSTNTLLESQLLQDQLRDLEKNLKNDLEQGITGIQEELGQFREDLQGQLDNLRGDFQREAEKTEEEIQGVKRKLEEACDGIMERVTILRGDIVNIGRPSASQPNETCAKEDPLPQPINEGRRRTRKRTAVLAEKAKTIRVDCPVCKKNLATSYIGEHLRKWCNR